jgi:hypothetical protein
MNFLFQFESCFLNQSKEQQRTTQPLRICHFKPNIFGDIIWKDACTCIQLAMTRATSPLAYISEFRKKITIKFKLEKFNIFPSEYNLFINYRRLQARTFEVIRTLIARRNEHVWNAFSISHVANKIFTKVNIYVTPNIQRVWEMLQNALVICKGTDKMRIASKKQKPNGHYAYSFDRSATWNSHLSRQILALKTQAKQLWII